MIRWVQIFGERCSGTTYLAHLVGEHFADVTVTSAFGGKHWFIKGHAPRGRANASTDLECVRPLADGDDTLFLVIVRDPLDWLRSLHEKPYHAPRHWGLEFSRFIREPWVSFETVQMSPHWRVDPSGIYFIEKADNVVRLRSQKLAHLRNLARVARHVRTVRYEALAARPGLLTTIAADHAIRLRRPTITADPRYFVGSAGTGAPFVRRSYPDIAAADLAFIREELDLALERNLGYIP